MNPEESYSRFRAFLKERQRTLKSLTIPDACEFMFAFYNQVSANGTSPKMGDGIGFAYDIMQRQRATPYELSVIRLFTTSDESPGPNGSRLRLSLGYSWVDAVGWFDQPDRGLPTGNSSFAWTRERSISLEAELSEHIVYKVLSQHSPRSVELRHEPQWNLRG